MCWGWGWCGADVHSHSSVTAAVAARVQINSSSCCWCICFCLCWGCFWCGADVHGCCSVAAARASSSSWCCCFCCWLGCRLGRCVVADGCCGCAGVGEGVWQLWVQTGHWLIVETCGTPREELGCMQGQAARRGRLHQVWVRVPNQVLLDGLTAVVCLQAVCLQPVYLQAAHLLTLCLHPINSSRWYQVAANTPPQSCSLCHYVHHHSTFFQHGRLQYAFLHLPCP